MATIPTSITPDSIGYVRMVKGDVVARATDGSERVLSVGDLVYPNEVIVTGAAGAVLIELRDGNELTVGLDSQVVLDSEVYGFDVAAEKADVLGDIADIQAAIAAGADPTEVTDAPAAGGEATGTAHDETQPAEIVQRTGEQVTPKSGFETGTFRNPEVEFPDDLGVEDKSGGSQTTLVNPVNDVPVAVDDSFTLNEDASVSASVSGNDTPSGDGGNVFALATNPSHGTVMFNADGTFTYTPSSNYNGPDSFTYTLTDADGDSSTATVNLTVNPVNDVPVITAVSAASVYESGLTIADGAPNNGNPDAGSPNATVYNGTFTATDADGNALIATLTAPAGSYTSNGAPLSWSLTPDGKTLTGTADYDGDGAAEDVIQVVVSDAGAYTVSLLGPIDHPVSGVQDALLMNVGLNVSDGVSTVTDSIPVTVYDDIPIGNDIVQNLSGSQDIVTTNLILILDRSGSMADNFYGDGLFYLQIARDALKTLINSADDAGNVNVMIVDFASDVSTSGWLVDDVNAAIDYLDSLVSGKIGHSPL